MQIPPLDLAVVNIIACSLIGLSTMIALCVFNFLLDRPFYSMNAPLKNDDENHCLDTVPETKSSNGNLASKPEAEESALKKDEEPPKNMNQSKWMKKILSFAVGGLLGDVFLHLLPGAAESLENLEYSVSNVQYYLGWWVIGGVVVFLILESVLTQFIEEDDEADEKTKKVTGYMNLVANAFDNFSHGMSVGASFLVGLHHGWCTTFAIIIHEIPHELADHAIMIRSGFTNWEAFKAQMSICLVTVMGALVVLFCGSLDQAVNKTLWILPLTAGGFVYIALGTLVPEVFQFDEIDFDYELKYNKLTKKWAKFNAVCWRILFILAGIFVMAAVNVFNFF